MVSFFGGTKDKTTTTTSGFNAPGWLQAYLDQNLQSGYNNLQTQANSTADQRIMGFTPDELAAQERIRSGVGQYDDIIGSALGTLQQAQQKSFEGVNPEDIQKFMNPYQQNVTDITKRETVRDADIARAKMQSGNNAASAFGGSGGLLRSMELDRNLGQQLTDTQYRGDADAFTNALNAARQSTTDSIAAGNAIGNLATTGSNLYSKDTASLAASGEAQRGLEQAKTDFTYTNPFNVASQGANLAQGVYNLYGTTGTTTTPVQQQGWGSQLLGGALAIGALGTGGGSTIAGSLLSGMMNKGGGGTNDAAFTNAASGFMPTPQVNSQFLKDGGVVHMKDGGEPKAALDKLNLSEIIKGTTNIPALTALKTLERFNSTPKNTLADLLTGDYKVKEGYNRAEDVLLAPAKAIAGLAEAPYMSVMGLAQGGSKVLDNLQDFFLTPKTELKKREEKERAQVAAASRPAAQQIEGILNPPPALLGEEMGPMTITSPQREVQPTNALESFSNVPVAASGLESLVSDKTSEPSALQKMIDGTNLPLLKMGLTMMMSDKPFAGAIGEGGLAAVDQIGAERKATGEAEASRAKNALEALVASNNQRDMESKMISREAKTALDREKAPLVKELLKANTIRANQNSSQFRALEAELNSLDKEYGKYADTVANSFDDQAKLEARQKMGALETRIRQLRERMGGISETPSLSESLIKSVDDLEE